MGGGHELVLHQFLCLMVCVFDVCVLCYRQVTPEVVAALADRIEVEIQGGMAQRPLLSVPHIISDESSCYYHGYVLAEVHTMNCVWCLSFELKLISKAFYYDSGSMAR